MRQAQSPSATRPWIKTWFVVDALVALAPPLYWAADGQTMPVFRIPVALLYFLAVATCITMSIVVAYLDERARAGMAA